MKLTIALPLLLVLAGPLAASPKPDISKYSFGTDQAATRPTGPEGEGYSTPAGHGQYHNGFYYGLFNNKKGVTCCHDKDCRPTSSRMYRDHYEVKINGVWQTVDPDAIIPKSAPDGGAHVCAGDPTTIDPLGRVYCVILPPET
jgi:hypothetical protein